MSRSGWWGGESGDPSEIPSERVRTPQPLVRRRMPSGRGATEQPNAAGDGPAALTGRFWVALVLTGVASGLLGAGLMAFLFAVQHATFGYHAGDFEHAVERVGDVRRIVPLVVAGAVAGPLWYLLRRATPGESADVDDEVWRGKARLSVRRCLGTGILSEIVVGMGASLGREQAPRVMGAASGSVLAGRFGLSTEQRRLLVACGAGAGLGAVYNVPLGGALYTVEVMLGSLTLPTVLPPLACSMIATATAWIYLPTSATYAGVPTYHFSGTVMAFALVGGPLFGLAASAYIRLIGWVSHHRVTGAATTVAPLLAFSVLGVIGFRYPQLFGNGKDLAHDVFVGHGTLLLLLALAALKPLVTALCLQSGASGGLFTPTLSTGAALGGFLGLAWSHLWGGGPVGAFAMIGASATIGASMQAPLAGLVLVLELTHSGFSIMVPMIAATVIATVVARHVDGYSIYSARLPAPRP
ncbi:MAG TPA: chloride channel protein [Acidimicrobiales bacterium]|nr:chloride channel protein [Acidimicrobiales bacterium]